MSALVILFLRIAVTAIVFAAAAYAGEKYYSFNPDVRWFCEAAKKIFVAVSAVSAIVVVWGL